MLISLFGVNKLAQITSVHLNSIHLIQFKVMAQSVVVIWKQLFEMNMAYYV